MTSLSTLIEEDKTEIFEVIDCTLSSLPQSLPPKPLEVWNAGSRGLKRSASVLDIPVDRFLLLPGQSKQHQPNPSRTISARQPAESRRVYKNELSSFPLSEGDWAFARSVDVELSELQKAKKARERTERGRELRRFWTQVRGGKVWDGSKGDWVTANSVDGARDGSNEDEGIGTADDDVEIKMMPTIIDVDQLSFTEGDNDYDETVPEGEEKEEGEEWEDDDIITDEASPYIELTQPTGEQTPPAASRIVDVNPNSPITPPASLILTPASSVAPSHDVSDNDASAARVYEPTSPSLDSSCRPLLLSLCGRQQENNQLPTPSPSPLKRPSASIVQDPTDETTVKGQCHACGHVSPSP
ncbi:hypothetical protein I317_04911 [Kwoniella heveanensis CBS 569]|nr:hypothetical protein I317_04911 [Kwoniella heveanensis CBS 569]